MTKKTTIELAKILKVKPEKAVVCLCLPLGKKVNQGDVIAEKKALFGKRQVKSPCKGVLSKVEFSSGNLIIVPEPKTKAGKKSGRADLIYGWGRAEGELVLSESQLRLSDLSDQYTGQVILAKKGVSEPGVVFKAEVLGVSGLIIVSKKQLDELRNDWQKTAGASEIGVGFIDKLKKKFKKLVGKKIKLDIDKGELIEA